MKTLKAMLKAAFYIFAIVLILLTGLLSFLLSTTPGIYTSFKLANFILPGSIQIKKPHGRLIDKFSVAEITYTDEAHSIVLKNVSIHWHPASILFKNHLVIKSFKAQRLNVSIAPKKPEDIADTAFELPQLPLKITLQQASVKQIKLVDTGQIFKNIHLESTLTENKWYIERLTFNYQDIRFVLRSNIVPSLPYAMDSFLTIQKTSPKGLQFKGEIKAAGDLGLYHWEGTFTQPAQLQLSGRLKNGKYLENIFQWQNIKWPVNQQTTLQTGKGNLTIKGSLSNLDIDLDTQIQAPSEGNWQLHVHGQDKQFTAHSTLRLDQGSIHSELQINLQAQKTFEGTISSKNLDLSFFLPGLDKLAFNSQFSGKTLDTLTVDTDIEAQYWGNHLEASAHFIHNKLQAKAKLGNNVLQINGRFPYQWDSYISVPQPALIHPSLKGLSTTLTVNASLSSATEGKLSLVLNDGYYKLPDDSPVSALHFNGGSLQGELKQDGISAKGSFTIDPQKTLNLSLKLPQFHLKDGLTANQPLAGSLHLTINSLHFLESLSQYIKKPQGDLKMNMLVKGTIANPMTEGKIQLNNGKILLPKSGLHLTNIDASLLTKNNNWQLKSSITSKDGALKINGQGLFYPAVTGEISAKGSDVELFNTNEYTLNVSPDLIIKFNGYNTDIRGSILIPKADITPQDFTESVNLSTDVVFKEEKEQQRDAANISADINIIMGNAVKLDVRGLKGFLDGAIRLQQQAGGSLNASGNLSIRQGAYTAYGQDLSIDQGELIFTGGLLTNPGINLRAVRHFSNANVSFSGSNQLFDFHNTNLQSINFANNTTVGIEVTGRLNSPDIQLFSNPAGMSQADILSMLLLGRPAHQADKAGGQLLLSAISALNLDTGTQGTQLLNQLKENLGFDFDVQSTSTYNRQTHEVSDSNQFVIGKSLSKRLYLSYNIGILQTDSNVLILKYLLNKYFTLQVTASDTGNGIDFLYTRQKK
ncbi:hypothetical protein FOG18_11175 [Legionella israelensis]|uniref:translocation/assembly module TamB domain-containing protein n=1 Tax=Legionella israelensis TaxID=454 RepID=UPI00117D537F|nr:translocation/assembly module TamB domain-containing protein [Legionella israelensis]QDP73084.1 hypothetical protein FOG18_11175 [Legionella israelensis]